VNWLLQWLRAPWTSSKRAQRRLIQVLTPEQCRDYRRSGLFIIDSQLGHRYLVGDGCRVRQLELDDCVGWRPTTAYCFMPASDEQVPQPDVILALTLLLSFNELHFLSTATVRNPQSMVHPGSRDENAMALTPRGQLFRPAFFQRKTTPI
jgi:hypothetical protein